MCFRHSYDQDFFFTATLRTEDGNLLSKGLLPLDKIYNNANYGAASLRSIKQVNANEYSIQITATDVVPYVWLDLNTTMLSTKHPNLLYYFSDNAFYITEPLTNITLYLYNVNITNLGLSDVTICWIYNC
jgi:hypothetical protein